MFSLQSGQMEDRYFWYKNTAGLACATPPSLTFIGQDVSSDGFGGAIFEASPGKSNATPSATGR